MFKLKIVHKGLLLVGVPLIVGIVLNLFLCYGFYLANHFAERGLMFKDATISFIKSTRCSALEKMCAMSYVSSHDQFYKEKYQANKQNAVDADAHLRAILKNEKNLVVPALAVSAGELLHGGGGGRMGMGGMRGALGGLPGSQSAGGSSNSPFLQELQRLADGEAQSAKHAMNSLQNNLLLSIVIIAFVSVALAVFFWKNITNRLLLILGNTVSLSQGTALRPALKGQDEIAELDQLLYKSATEIRELERFKKEMIGVVSHELKSPLSSVGSFLSSLSEGVYGELSDKAKDKVGRTYNNVKRLMGLVAELLLLDRLELEMKPEELNAADLLSASVDSVKELSEKTGVPIEVKNDLNSKIYVDRNRLVQVIVNLLSNAMKFSPEGGTVTLECSGTDGFFECRVRDQGRGIPEAHRKQIFEPFQQVDAKDATAKKGTGLGLTISKSIVEQHGGKIGVDSEEGKGSCFWFKIPLDPSLVKGSKEAVVAGNSAMISGGKPGASLSLDFKNSTGKRKFSVLQQGLVIISIPLIFQTTFVGVLGYMISKLRDQTKAEEHSQEILNVCNQMAERLAGAVNYGMMFSFSKSRSVFSQWEESKRATLALVDKAKTLCASDPQAQNDLEQCRLAINKMSDSVNVEATQGGTSQGIQKLLEMAGMGNVLGGRNPIELMMSMRGQFPGGEGEGPGGFGGFGGRHGFRRHRRGGFSEHEEGAEGSPTGELPMPGADPSQAGTSSKLGDAHLPAPPLPGSLDSKHGGSPKLGDAHLPPPPLPGSLDAKHSASSALGDAPLAPPPLPGSGDSESEHGWRERGGEGGMEMRREIMEKVLSSVGKNGDREGMGKMRKLVEGLNGMGPVAFGGPPDERGDIDPMAQMGGLSKIAGLLSSFSGGGAMGAMSMMSHMQNVMSNSVQVKMVRPLLEAQAAQDKMMDREKANGEKLSAQRAPMVRNLQIALVAGMLLNGGLSVFLAIYLMKNLTGRLQHVMENTSKLVKREQLDPPKSGSDEIAYLDKVLFETGNHLVELENFKKELISIVSHELRTPLLSVSSALELFSAGAMGELSEKGKNRLKLAREESNRLIRLINDLLDIEKMDAGKFVLDKSDTAVGDLVAQAVESVANLAEQKHITIDSIGPGVASFKIHADKDRLCQVLINFLSNAVKYSPDGGTIKIRVAPLGDQEVKFSVIDQGRGIPQDLREKIFDRFVQVEESDATVKGGSGLGLAISKAIIEQHGGTIGAESVMGMGSEFWFKLPVKQASPSQETVVA